MVRHKKINGVRYHEVAPDVFLPGVTAVLSATQNNRYLNQWKAKVGVKQAKQAQKAGVNRGKYTHDLIERFVDYRKQSEIVPQPKFVINDHNQTKQIQQLGRCALDYVTRIDTCLFLETSFFIEDAYAGTPDFVGLKDNKIILFDWKTSYKRKTKSAMGDYCLQLAAYRRLVEENTRNNVDEARVVLFYANEEGHGGVNEVILSAAELDSYYTDFELRLARFQEKQQAYEENLKLFQAMPF